MSTRGRPLALATVAIVGPCLAACGNSGNGTASSTTTSTRPGSTRAGSTSPTGAPASVPNQPAVRQDVTLSNCASAPGGWSAGGAVKNTEGHDATYHITDFFTTAQATDLTYGTVLCVLRGVSVG
jgi:hypothetical protein